MYLGRIMTPQFSCNGYLVLTVFKYYIITFLIRLSTSCGLWGRQQISDIPWTECGNYYTHWDFKRFVGFPKNTIFLFQLGYWKTVSQGRYEIMLMNMKQGKLTKLPNNHN